VAAALIGIRGTKSQAKVSMRAELGRVEITGPADQVAGVASAAEDLRAAGKIAGELVFTSDPDADGITVQAELAEAPQD
jgi:valyl-tRNA synthetase